MLSSEGRISVYQCIPIGLITMDYMANTQNTPTYVSVRSLCIGFFWFFLHVFEMLHHINTIDPRGTLL